MEVWKIMFHSKWVIFRFHVNLPGCTTINTKDYGQVHPYRWWKKSPAPVEVGSFHHILQGFFTSQVVQDFFHGGFEHWNVILGFSWLEKARSDVCVCVSYKTVGSLRRNTIDLVRWYCWWKKSCTSYSNRYFIPLSTGFYTFQVVQDFSINSITAVFIIVSSIRVITLSLHTIIEYYLWIELYNMFFNVYIV